MLRLANENAVAIAELSRIEAHNQAYLNAVNRVRNGENATLVAQQANFNRKTILADSKKPDPRLLVPLVDEPINEALFYTHQNLVDAVNRVCGGEKINSVHRSTGISRSTIDRAVQRFNGDHLEELTAGRPAAVSPELVESLKLSAAQRTLDGNSWERVHNSSNSAVLVIPGFQAVNCENSFAHELQTKRNAAQNLKYGSAIMPYHVQPLSTSTVRKIEKEVCSKVVITSTDKGGQNKRRAQALADLYNFISLAVALYRMTE